jgi:ribosomal protein S18 acetylase RimI-like enzyme
VNIQLITADEALPVRQQVLWPDKPLSFCRVADDEDGIHYGAYVNNELVSVASVYVLDRQARLRKFATYASHQGKGIGSRVLNHIIADLSNKKIGYFWCDARETAIDFYRRFGMEVESERFYKSNVAYVKMSLAFHPTD